MNNSILTIPKSITGREELVILPRKELEKILQQRPGIHESHILQWAAEAKSLKKTGKLAVLKSLKSL